MILEYAGLSIRILVKEQAHDYLLLKVAGAWALIIKSVAGRVFHRPRKDFRRAEELQEVCLGPGTNDAMRANNASHEDPVWLKASYLPASEETLVPKRLSWRSKLF